MADEKQFTGEDVPGGDGDPGTLPQAPPAPAGPRRRWLKSGPNPAAAIKDFGSPALPGYRSNIHCVTIIGQVEGHMVLPPQNKTTKYEHILPQLVAVEQNAQIKGLLVLLNTVGGDVEAGLAIAEVIASISKPTVSVVLGGGHSIGVPISVSADYSLVVSTATMTIHPIRMSGIVIGIPQSCEYLAKMQDRVVNFVVRNSRISEARFRDLMLRTGELARDVGTILVGQEAVKEGLIDEVGGIDGALLHLQEMINAQNNGKVRGAAPLPVAGNAQEPVGATGGGVGA